MIPSRDSNLKRLEKVLEYYEIVSSALLGKYTEYQVMGK
jgi:hypothetical protein